MIGKGVKLKSESFFSISYGVLELWRKNPKGMDSPGPDRVKGSVVYTWRGREKNFRDQKVKVAGI